MSVAEPLFSVIIPVYNRADLIAATLESILAQEWKDFEIIVVDDGSSDHSAECARAVSSAIRVFTVPNGGPGPARNHGISEAKGRYLAFLDSDDLWFPWTLATYARALEENDWPSILFGQPFVFSDQAAVGLVEQADLLRRRFENYLSYPDEKIWWGVSSFVLKREVVAAVNGFFAADFHAEDAELLLRLGTAPGMVWIQAPHTFAYRQHAGSIMKQTQKNHAGLNYLLGLEEAGQYPGGTLWAKARRKIITTYTRSASIGMLNEGNKSWGWELYRRTFRWHLALGRWRYLLVFPLLYLFK